MLAAFEAQAATPAHRRRRHHGGGSVHDAKVVEWAPVATVPITFPGRNGTLMAAWAAAAGEATGAVLVIHENRGLTDHIREVAGRFAASGWSALALDLLSEEGGTGAFPGEAEVSAKLAAIPPIRFDEDMLDALTELERRVARGGLAAIGFCFGGGMIWRLLATGDDRLDAAAPFYGPFPENASLEGAEAAVLGVYGGLDERVNATRPAAEAALAAAGLDHQILVFSQANHAFFNNTGERFNPPAAAEAWRRTLSWFGRFAD
jgi:carboxymethylenebutenolidase